MRWNVIFKSAYLFTFDVTDGHWWIPRGYQGVATKSHVYAKRKWDPAPPKRFIKHEACHVKQWRETRWFLLKYIGQVIKSLFGGENKFELEARKWEKYTNDHLSIKKR